MFENVTVKKTTTHFEPAKNKARLIASDRSLSPTGASQW